MVYDQDSAFPRSANPARTHPQVDAKTVAAMRSLRLGLVLATRDRGPQITTWIACFATPLVMLHQGWT